MAKNTEKLLSSLKLITSGFGNGQPFDKHELAQIRRYDSGRYELKILNPVYHQEIVALYNRIMTEPITRAVEMDVMSSSGRVSKQMNFKRITPEDDDFLSAVQDWLFFERYKIKTSQGFLKERKAKIQGQALKGELADFNENRTPLLY